MAIDEVVDDYENETLVSSTYEVIQNTTLDVMELNSSGLFGPTFEEFLTYTEVDAETDITVTDTRVTWITQRRDANNYVYFDFGAGYWGDFVCNFTYVVSDIEAGDGSNAALNWIFAIANHTSRVGIGGANVGVLLEISENGAVDDRFRFRLGVLPAATFGAFRNIGTFYISIDKSGATVRFRVWSDSTHTALLETIIIIGNVEVFRYLSVAIGYDGGADPADHSSGYIENLWIGEYEGGYSTSGYFNTTNFLAGLSYNATVLLTDTSIPSGSINAEISPDGSTWTDLGALDVGRGALDLRDLGLTDAILRFNFTRGLSTETPRLSQVRLVHEGPGAGVGNVTLQNVTGAWVLHNLSSILTLVGTLDSGDLNSTLDIDGDSYTVSEVVGAPGFLISFNWTAVDLDAHCLWIVINAWYDGNLAHDVDVELYNHTSLAWVDLGHIVDGVGFEWFNASIYSLRIPMDFLNGGGEVWGRINHVQAGNINHDLFIEYLKLMAFIPSDVTPTVSGAVVTDVTPFIAIGLILALSMYLLADRIRK